MATIRRDYIITHHLRERFIQRTQKRYIHLRNCNDGRCLLCPRLRDEIKAEALRNRDDIDNNIYSHLSEAEEDRSYLNSSGFMEWYYNKYGFDKRFEFLVHDGLLFVVVLEEGKKVIVTCVMAKTHIAGRSLLNRVKFNHIKKPDPIAIDMI